MIVYVKEPGVFGVVVSEYTLGYVVKWYLDGIEFQSFLLEDEYVVYHQNKVGGLDV